MRGLTLIQCPWSNGLKANARGQMPENIYLVALDLTIFEIRPLNLESELLYRIINNNSPLAVNDPVLMARGIF